MAVTLLLASLAYAFTGVGGGRPATWQPIYTSGFEATPYTAAALNGQGGWTAGLAGTTVGSSTPALDGSQWVRVKTGDEISQNVSGIAGKEYRVRVSVIPTGKVVPGGAVTALFIGYVTAVCEVLFNPTTGTIQVLDPGSHETNVAWSVNTRYDVIVSVPSARATYTVNVNGADIFTGTPQNGGSIEAVYADAGNADMNLDAYALDLLQ